MIYLAPLLLLGYASIIDLKQREVPDWVSIFLLFLGIFINTYKSLIFHTFTYILGSLLAVSIVLLLVFLLTRTNSWGMGDSKILIGISSIIGLTPRLELFYFIVISIFIGAIYGIIYIGFLLLKYKSRKIVEYLFLLSLFIISAFLFYGYIISDNGEAFLIPLFLLLLISIMLVRHLSVFIEKNILLVKKRTDLLVEGDWLGREIKIKNRVFKKHEPLTDRDITYIKKHRRYVWIREGIPFVPVFFFSFCIYIFLETFINSLSLL